MRPPAVAGQDPTEDPSLRFSVRITPIPGRDHVRMSAEEFLAFEANVKAVADVARQALRKRAKEGEE